MCKIILLFILFLSSNVYGNDLDDALIEAIGDGKLTEVKTLIKNGVTINAKDYGDGNTALMGASSYGHTEIVKLLIENNVDVNAQGDSPNDATALMFASQEGHIEIVKLLIENNANVNAQNDSRTASVNRRFSFTNTNSYKKGDTALLIASRYGHTEIVKLLLGNNADTTIKDHNNWTALLWAAYNCHAETVKILLEYNAEVNVRNDARTALDKKNYGMMHSMVPPSWGNRPVNPNSDKYGETALMYASSAGHTKIVKLLLENDAEVNAPDTSNWTSLVYATEAGHTEIVTLLIQNGANVNAGDGNALLIAFHSGQIEIIKILIESGADANVNAKDRMGRTALSQAGGFNDDTQKEHDAIQKLLKDAGAKE